MKRKKILTVLLATQMAVVLLSGCGKTNVATVGRETVELSNEALTEEDQDFIAGMQAEMNGEDGQSGSEEVTQYKEQMTLTDAVAQLTCYDEVKNSTIDGKYQIWDFVVTSNEITIGEIISKLAESPLENGEINCSKKVYYYDANYKGDAFKGEGDEMYSTSKIIKYSLLYSDGNLTVDIPLLAVQDPEKTNENGASYVNDYKFITFGDPTYLTGGTDCGIWSCITDFMNGEEIYSMTREEVAEKLATKGFTIANSSGIGDYKLCRVPLENSVLCPVVLLPSENTDNIRIECNIYVDEYASADGRCYILSINEMSNKIGEVRLD